MAERKGGKQSPGDVGTEQDRPTEQAAGVDAAAEQAELTQEQAAEQAEASAQPKPRRRAKAASPAEGAAETTVDQEAAEAADEAAPAADAPAPAEAPDTPAPAPRRRGAAPRDVGSRPVVRAQAKYVRTSARKARLVCEHIRGKSVDEARAILAFTPRAVAKDWAKLLDSAVANAEHNHELLGDDLMVETAYADEGPTLKRFRPRAQGRATRIRKRTSHLTITLTPKG